MLSFDEMNKLYGYLTIKNIKDNDQEINTIIKKLENELNQMVGLYASLKKSSLDDKEK